MKLFELNDSLFLPHCACDVQLTLQAGEARVLVGENGLGKSTLLHRFCDMVSPAQRVMVEQKNAEYFFDRKLIHIKNFFLEEKLGSFNREIFLKLWSQFQLDLKEDRLLSQLSGGESQCLKLCLTLCKEASFYFLDEPTHYLDHTKKQVLKEHLLYLQKQNKSLLMVEHNREWLASGWIVSELMIHDDCLKLGGTWTI